MKKFSLLSLLIIFYISTFCQNTNIKKNDSILLAETAKYIEKEYDSKYMVFVIHGYESDSSKNSFCFSIRYILNDYDYEGIDPTYYFELNNKIVLVMTSNTFNISNFNVFKPQKINNELKEKAINTLSPISRGSATYEPSGLIYCKVGDRIESTYYKNADDIPFEKSIRAKRKRRPANSNEYFKKVDW